MFAVTPTIKQRSNPKVHQSNVPCFR